MGSKYKSDELRARNQVFVCLTDSQYAKLMALVDQKDISVSAFLRKYLSDTLLKAVPGNG